MNRPFIAAVVFALLFINFGFSPKTDAQQMPSKSKKTKPTPTPPSVEIEKLELNKNEVLIPCPPSLYKSSDIESPCNPNNKDAGLVFVEAIIKNPKNVPIIYQYTVSGGRIVGQGNKVVWHLYGIRPGDYTITASVDEGRGFNEKTVSQTVKLLDSCCCISCTCPSLAVTVQGNFKAGETIEFTANLAGGTGSDYTYDWKVSQGEIVEGQGSSKIFVKTTNQMSGSVKATVEINGFELCELCLRTASETAEIVK